jgi:autotransporter-associated beta strand protein
MGLGAASAPADIFVWDPLGNNSGAGDGNWDASASTTVSNWWNGATDVAWKQTGPTTGTNGSIFAGSDGTWNVTNVIQVSTTNMVINNSGYTFWGNPFDLFSGGNLNLADGKTVTFNCNMSSVNNAKNYIIGHGSVMNICGNILASQPKFIGPSDSAFYLGGPNSVSPGVVYILGPTYLTNGYLQTGASFFMGYRTAVGGPGSGTYSNGTLTVSGGATLTTGGSTLLGRSGGQATLTLLDGTINVDTIGSGQRDLQLTVDANSFENGIVNVFGGTLNVGVVGSSTMIGTIKLLSGGSAPAAAGPGEIAILYQTNGVINAWGGITLGAASGSFNGGSALVTNSGGYLYLGPTGIRLGQVFGGTNIVSLSGGAVGALADWSSSLPMILDGINGNITFLCADNFGSAHNIALTGPLSGPGGLNVAGQGVLTLSAANTYAGSTTLSNGTLVLKPSSTSLTNGNVTVDASAGSPILSLQLGSGFHWAVSGLIWQNGTPTSDFQFGTLPPSSSVAPLLIAGNLNFAATPNVNVGGSAIPPGTYPLLQYTGAMSGTPPTSVTLPSYCSGYVTNLAASKTIALVVTTSTLSPALSWAVGNGLWDINTTANWNQYGGAVKYNDGSQVVFDDTASGTSPITVTLNMIVQPSSVGANNTLKNFIIAGTGGIAGSASLAKQGLGTLTLDTPNAYTGGTVLSSGQLNINNGGDNSGLNSAIGAGPLTIAAGAALDNTSGSNVVLMPNIAETWNGDFTYIGSSNSLNTGSGGVTMNGNTSLGVNRNNLTIGGTIGDNGKVFKLTKSGNGALTLPVANSFAGGLELFQGQINFGDPGAGGQGQFYIDGGTIDNISGGPLAVNFPSYQWIGSFTYAGSTTNALTLAGGPVTFAFGGITATVLGGAMEWDLDLENGNQLITKDGPGTLIIGGIGTALHQMGISVNAGVLEMARTVGFAIANWPGSHKGMIVQSNALALDLGYGNPQIGHGTGIPITLQSGGILDLNANSETVDSLTLNGGILMNGDTNFSLSTLSIVYPGGVITLQGVPNQINVAANSGLALNASITGSGGFVMNGPGTLTLEAASTYTGSTTIESGTIALAFGGAIAASSNIALASAGTALDLTQSTNYDANGNSLLTLQSGQTLSGFGVVNGLVATMPGATLAPGSSSTVGTLTVTGFSNDTNLLGGVTLMKLNKAGGTNDQLVVQQGNLVLGGSLMLTNLAGALAASDTFTLFAAPGGISGSFASITPAWPGPGLLWNTSNLAVNGTISLVAAPPAVPARITSVSASGGSLTVHGNNGVANGPYMVLGTTNLALSRASWVHVLAGSFDGSGSFSFSVSTTGTPAEFFTVVQP